jgi:surface carbohydrate biosynthesis protein
MINVTLICDHKWRDLPGLVWLQCVLQRSTGWNAGVVSKIGLPEHLALFPPSIIVIPSSNPPWLEHAAEWRKAGVLVVLLPTEGRPTYGKTLEWSVSSRDGSQADLVLLWSEKMAEIWQGCAAPNALAHGVTGPTRFDFYREPLRQMLPTAGEFAGRLGIDDGVPMVSWATAFPHAKFHGGGEEWQVNDWVRMGLGNAGLTEDDMRELIRGEFQSRETSWSTLRACAEALPELAFCLKPHPFEDFAWCESTLAGWREAGLSNVYLVKGFYIWDLLNACSLHIHRACTTGTEAWLLDTPTLELGFVHDHSRILEAGTAEPGASRDAESAEDVVDTPGALIERIKYYLRGGPVDPELQTRRTQYCGKWFYQVDGNATQRAVESIIAESEQHEILQHRFWAKKNLRTRLSSMAKSRLGLPYDEPVMETRGEPGHDVDARGHWDRVICQRDVLEWDTRLKRVAHDG